MPDIMIVEDDTAVLDLLGEVATELGYSAVTSHDGEDALSILQRDRYRLLIVDMMMYPLNGTEVARRAREWQSDIAVIMISGYLKETIDLSQVVADSQFLEKPFSLTALAALIRQMIGNPQPMMV